MIFLANMVRPSSLFIFSLLATVSTVSGCGVLPAGQGSTRNFNVTGFTLPVSMVYSTATDVPPQTPGIATSEAGARRFVEGLVMQTIIDVLENQAHSALLPDAVISTILNQLTVTVTYTPLMCPKVRFGAADQNSLMAMETSCIIIDNTVTAICFNMDVGIQSCTLSPLNPRVRITPVSGPPLTISGSLSTTNIILASWSRAMWQSVVNRAIRMLASGPFRSHFFSAVGTVDGN
ncbi:hypothetical protein KIN20_021763 [Parelaphostrongylus tenuis]|uniref:Uncharacterized protein n=1 Tax=Parelaphostrongylus tenuis TaxID=148309 RepID=A0AAD5QWD6_PARTN|nr:hypothetical protein KIN20_021763 [Parelaphostrongylus tenuis]